MATTLGGLHHVHSCWPTILCVEASPAHFTAASVITVKLIRSRHAAGYIAKWILKTGISATEGVAFSGTVKSTAGTRCKEIVSR